MLKLTKHSILTLVSLKKPSKLLSRGMEVREIKEKQIHDKEQLLVVN